MSSSEHVSEIVARTLIAPGFGWIDDFIDPDQARELRALADHNFSAGEFHAAGIGPGEVNLEIRRDHISWIDPAASPEPLRSILDRYQSFLPVLNSTCFLGLKSMESMLSIYPAGAFYRRHRDRFRQVSHRVVSLVLYLNEDWSPDDGGELIVHPERDPEDQPEDQPEESRAHGIVVEPRVGRLMVFLSELEHEVRVTKAPRYSLATWLLDRPA